MRIDLNFQLLELSGEPVLDVTGKPLMVLSKIVANNLLGVTEGIEPMKARGWAESFWNDGFIEVDEADCDKFKAWIERHPGFNNLIKSDVLKVLKTPITKQPYLSTIP